MTNDGPATDIRLIESGTAEVQPEPLTVRRGQMTASISSGALRSLRFGGVEVLRQIDFPVRDVNWATLPPENVTESISERAEETLYSRSFDVSDGALSCTVTYALRDDDTLVARGVARANRDFETNRTGFTLLHPLAGVAGRPVWVSHSDGAERQHTMPALISPGQPMLDIAGMRFRIDGVDLDIRLSGDVFEMEDQRNWTDASFKTYSRPLAMPFPYRLRAGETEAQEIVLTMSGEPAAAAVAGHRPLSIGPAKAERLPTLLLAAQHDWLPEVERAIPALASIAGGGILYRLHAAQAPSELPVLGPWLAPLQAPLNLEIVLEDSQPALPQLETVAEQCRNAGLDPTHVIALPAAYLDSYQPTGEWPSGLSSEESVAAAATAFPRAKIGAGMLTNFTEFNRCRPEKSGSDYITHGNSATVHAADDDSVSQTLESLPDIFRTAAEIGAGRAYRLGLTSIGMRTNPYGGALSPNPEQVRRTMTDWDPRARALFGAAWSVGVLAQTDTFGIEAMALAAPCGPFGVLSVPSAVERPWYADMPQAVVYPLYHVLRFAAPGGARCEIEGVPAGLHAVAFEVNGETRLMVANNGAAPVALSLPGGGQIASLDCATFSTAVCDPAWLDRAFSEIAETQVPMAPRSVIFGRYRKGATG
ncbi:hypothetical protein [Frigidibacter sp. ROC022]|uniref:hypothetical protein n=1 Tax=Frigidibacter sp. ROC022 TaxID=2971796 RepID=UPI00215AB681|nr:hypothetical protein [Frigidibacter sp. ROC022]MCR8722776.1 hypothetical protein [Frigidibacter sp. ROC022]